MSHLQESVVLSSLTQNWTWQSLNKMRHARTTSAAVSTSSQHKGTDREKAYASFNHQGIPVCYKCFFLDGIGKKRLKKLAKSLKENGLVPCTHGNAGRLPRHTFSISSAKFVVRFLLSYAEQRLTASRKGAWVQPFRHTALTITCMEESCLESVMGCSQRN